MSDTVVIRGHEEVLAHTVGVLRSLAPPGAPLALPPPAALETKTEYLEYVDGQLFKAKITFEKKHTNAVGAVQGGFLSVAFDNLIGPLSYLVAKGPTTSLSLTTQFLRPLFAGQPVTITAVVKKAGRNAVYIQAEAVNQEGKLVATADSQILVIKL